VTTENAKDAESIDLCVNKAVSVFSAFSVVTSPFSARSKTAEIVGELVRAAHREFPKTRNARPRPEGAFSPPTATPAFSIAMDDPAPLSCAQALHRRRILLARPHPLLSTHLRDQRSVNPI
jgi:hypothetical protein